MGLNKQPYLATVLASLLGWLGIPAQAQAQLMSDYTYMPITINKTVTPNILFLVDMGNATIEAAYAGTGYYYPLSFKSSSAPTTYDAGTSKAYYASNVGDLPNISVGTQHSGGFTTCNPSTTSRALRAAKLDGTYVTTTPGSTSNYLTPAECNSANWGTYTYQEITIPNTYITDSFNPATKYYGLFDPERCYTSGANSFQIGTGSSAIKGTGNYSAPCPDTKWDGNFLNWLAMRKQDIIQKVFIGGSGRTTPAQANLDGTANSLAGYITTGENGANTTCNVTGGTVTACWRYVKYVPLSQLNGRVPTSGSTALPQPIQIVGGCTLSVCTYYSLKGTFFGVGEGTIYVNDNAGVDPFDTALANQYQIRVDLTSEPNNPAGNGSFSGTCPDPNDPNFAGHQICYLRDQSLGLFQQLETGNSPMHVGVMMVNASTGKGGSAFFNFDDAYNANVMATLRNEQIMANSPLAESLYEALCLYRKSQGPCYSNSGSAMAWGTNYTSATNVAGDPFYFASFNGMVSCCKNYVLMISAGIGIADGNNPDLQTPFPTGSTINPAYSANIGVKASTSSGDATSAAAGDRLDDVAYYGRTHDLRADLSGSQYVTFYGVNAMGRFAGATLLASAAKYGGFNDKNGDGTSNFNPTSGQTCTYPTGSNIYPGGSGSFYSDPEWDKDANCVPDTFYDANDGYSLVASVQNAINDILKDSSSGTAISVLASSSSGEGTIYQAYFYPETDEGNRKVMWTGYLEGLFTDSYGNVREDRGGAGDAPDGRLVYTDDNIILTAIDPNTGDVVIQRYADANGDGKADSTTPYETVPLRSTQGLWEAGQKLALRDISANPRNLFAWVDKNNDGVVTANEQLAFTTANASTLAPYLRAASSGTYTAANIISFFQGNQVSGMRDRQLTVKGQLSVWRLGDIVNSSPTIIGPPKERFDILYGDTGYRQFLQRWSNRRLVAYVGANDGMLHAFNAGYFHRGDDPSTTDKVEHGWYTTAPTDNSSGTALGEELWGFIPHYLLPQLSWYTQSAYTHVTYVDLKPKVTDVRIFTPEAACGSSLAPTPTATGCIHPDGWGTILIMGLRFGGSCGACTSPQAPPLSVTADFDGTGTTSTRYFYSGYIVLDITNPDATPTVLSAYSSPTLGLTTAYPAVVRMSPAGNAKTDHTGSVWSMVVGSGAHGYDGQAKAVPSLIGQTLVQQGAAPTTAVLPVGQYWGFMSDAITYDKDLDFRSDIVYTGQTLSGVCNSGGTCTTNGTNWNNSSLNSPAGSDWWTGKLLRLTMGSCTSTCDATTWGIASSGNRVPTEVVAMVPVSGVNMPLGPLTASPTVTLDNSGNTWVFFGTGRYLSQADKVDHHRQYLIGVKDSVMSGCVQSTTTSCKDENLLDITNAALCISCSSGVQVQNMGSTTTFNGLIDKMQGNASAGIPAMDGWLMQLPTNTSSTTMAAERSVVNPTLIGGAAFFPTFTPSSDPCGGSGTSRIYGLYYLTGMGYTDPIFGVDANGMAITSVSAGQGLASAMAVKVSSDPTGLTGIGQSSNASFFIVRPKPPAVLWSQYMSWISQRM